ncbi:putative periplasmic binding protein-like I [Rosa chinensis]|uniref:Glutamate receptor n=2 Tax=Rosa chinensis TaxID=74649 RepID=A0A2P6Q4F9_ROSCH|nr:putative periplasmic binding protein-like I [Rosa chinensis]
MSFCFTFHTNRLLVPLLITCLIICLEGVAVQNEKIVTNVGAIINADSRIGKEQKAAMEIAAESFNNKSGNTRELILHFQDSGGDPFLAASEVEELIKEKKVEVIVGMETWQEAALVADHVGNQSKKIPVISFAAPAITVPLMQQRWPFLIRMASNGSAQMKCIADIVSAYKWKRVVVIYEDDGYGGQVGLLALLSEALQDANAKIENHLVLPRLNNSSMAKPNWDEVEELLKLPTFQSRVFIVLQSSLPTVTNLFSVARKMGLVGRESAWIITECITSLLDPQGDDSMEGTLGIKTDYATESSSYAEFQKEFQAKYAEENNSKPGIYALRAYDTITVISKALERMPNNTTNTSLQNMITTLLSNYKGLSGNMHLKEGAALLDSLRFRIINVVDGKRNKELNFWPPEVGFSEGLGWEASHENLTRAPQGWGMPTAGKPMKFGVPAGNKHFGKFVKVEPRNNSSYDFSYDGFSIRIFYTVLTHLNYHLPFEFVPFNGSYDDLVEGVYNKTFDAAVGDFTILPERMEKVEFTQPYMKSGLSMIVVEKYDESTWMFVRPFTWKIWVASGAILIYTSLVVWFLERTRNPEFDGSLKNQIGTATYITFSSLFFAHKEKVYTNFARVVFLLWLFIVLILSSSYTASLSSMLTTQRPTLNVTTEMLNKTGAKVGWDGGPFVSKYLSDTYKFDANNRINVSSENSYTDAFKSKNITAMFLELPYAQVYMNELCEGYTSITEPYEFGGFSFIFQKGSPIARDFSKAILELLENGYIKQLQNELLTPENQCPNTNSRPKSLSINSFSGLYVICGATSTLCLLLSFTPCVRKSQKQEKHEGNAGPSDECHLRSQHSNSPQAFTFVEIECVPQR